jgi:hypothetical protein
LDFESGSVAGLYDEYYNARHGNDLMPLVIDPMQDAAKTARQLGDYIVRLAKAEKARRARAA